jgi:hypothetical protein
MNLRIGDLVYASVSGYAGVYCFMGKLGNKLRLMKPGNPYFCLVVSPDKVGW